MKKTLLLFFPLIVSAFSFSQNVGIGTTTPNAKAVLEIKATDKGVLFPRMTSAQRNAITNPPDGLHIYNTTEHCLNYYDSLYAIWNCYCSDCQIVVINIGIGDDMCNVDFYNKYAKNAPAKKYIINLPEDTYIYGCTPGDTALSFANMPTGTSVVINNYGFILGAGGKGGAAQIPGACSTVVAQNGGRGGAAIFTKSGVLITVNNYERIAGGGGGGGGSMQGSGGYGGGGGGGAGWAYGTGGSGGGINSLNCGQFGCVCVTNNPSQPGSIGTTLAGGTGGAGSNGGPAGGNGGLRGQAGQNGNGTTGGAGGKAIAGGSGNIINNMAVGQSFGGVD